MSKKKEPTKSVFKVLIQQRWVRTTEVLVAVTARKVTTKKKFIKNTHPDDIISYGCNEPISWSELEDIDYPDSMDITWIEEVPGAGLCSCPMCGTEVEEDDLNIIDLGEVDD